ncbi:MAG TPA: hypothetical protein VLF41_01195 [Candidatus Nanoarchaeia archaeon]|nr:hypothetical protein [Candidatus Nanoarchaeia archaeon]
MRYVVDRPRAEVVLGKVWERYLSKQKPYHNLDQILPQNHIPTTLPRGGEEEAWYWMVVCLWMRGGVGSTESSKKLSWLYDWLHYEGAKRNPFDPGQAMLMEPDEIVELLRRAQLGMHQVAPDWIYNAQQIVYYWGGSVLNLFDLLYDYQTACERTMQGDSSFAGFKYKMTSMILYFLIEANLIEPFAYPPPVDFHLQRLALATEMIRPVVDIPMPEIGRISHAGAIVAAKSDRDYMEMEALLRDLYQEYEASHGIDPNRFADALWVHSRELCRYNPGNATHQIGEEEARATPLEPHLPDWSGNDQTKFEASCFVCPVREHCTNNVPSGPRYRWGTLILTPRTEPAQEPMFFQL